MKRSFKTWLSLFMAMVFVGSACNLLDENLPEPTEDEGAPIQLALRINVMDETTTNSRAGTDYDSYDSYVDPDHFNCLFFSNNNNDTQSPYAVSMIGCTSHIFDGLSHTFYGTVDTIPPYNPVKFVTLANLPEFRVYEPGLRLNNGTLHDVMYSVSAFRWPAGSLPSETLNIPMYGIFGGNFSNSWKSASKLFDLTWFSLNTIRAVARIYVRSNDELTKVQISRCNTVGFACPRNYYWLSLGYNVTSGTHQWTDGDMNIPGEGDGADVDPKVATDVPFIDIGATDDYKYNYVLYLPEYRNAVAQENSGTGGTANPTPSVINPATLDVTIKGRDHSVTIGEYTDGDYNGKPLNIVRNYTYNFILTSESGRLKVKYSVRQWDEKTSGDILFD